MENVPDFIILKDVYDSSRLKWSPGERFKCLINNCYYFGKVVKCTPFSMGMPKSLWQNCYVEWDSKEEDNRYVSPWDIQTTDSEENSEGMHAHLHCTDIYWVHTACDQQKLLKLSIYFYTCVATLSILYNTVDCFLRRPLYFMDFTNLPLFANYIFLAKSCINHMIRLLS